MTLGRLLRFDRKPVEIDLATHHRQVGVRGFGRGLIDYGQHPASTLSKLRYFELGASRLVLSNIKAWEGAVAVTSAKEAGRIASNRFLQYVAGQDVDLGYVWHWLLSDAGLAALGAASPGSADRNRTLSIKNFESIEIPLPEFDDQRRIAEHLDKLDCATTRVRAQLALADSSLALGALPDAIAHILRADSPDAPVQIGDLATVVSDTVHPGDDLGDARRFIGLQHILPHLGRRDGSLPVEGLKGRKFRFQPGDVTYGYLRPYQNKVWCADRVGLCSVEQFVLRPAEGVDGEQLSALLRSDIVLRPVNAATNNLQLPRLGLKTLLSLPVPDIRRASPQTWDTIRRMTDHFAQVKDLRARRRALQSGILPAARNEIFNSLR